LYTVETDEQAQQQVAALPPEALSAYAEVRALLEVNPWAGESYHRGIRTRRCAPSRSAAPGW